MSLPGRVQRYGIRNIPPTPPHWRPTSNFPAPAEQAPGLLSGSCGQHGLIQLEGGREGGQRSRRLEGTPATAQHRGPFGDAVLLGMAAAGGGGRGFPGCPPSSRGLRASHHWLRHLGRVLGSRYEAYLGGAGQGHPPPHVRLLLGPVSLGSQGLLHSELWELTALRLALSGHGSPPTPSPLSAPAQEAAACGWRPLPGFGGLSRGGGGQLSSCLQHGCL